MKLNKVQLKITREQVFKLLAISQSYLYPIERNGATLYSCHEEAVYEISGIYGGVSNGFLAELYFALVGDRVEVIGEPEQLFVCSCCGMETKMEKYDIAAGTGYDICRFCGWEDDGTVDPTVHTSVNRGSMEDYRNEILKNPNRFNISKWKVGTI